MIKILLLNIAVVLLMATQAYSGVFFEKDNTFYEPIPAVPTVATDSTKYVNAIIHADNGGTWSATGSTEYAVPVWQASADTANVTVIIDSQDYVFLNTTSHRTEAQTIGGTEFTLMDDTGDYLYVGDVSWKNVVYFKLHTLGAGYTLSVDYMKAGGAWQAVTNLVDGTSGFSSTACDDTPGASAWACKISFDEPSDEATGEVNGIGSRYWLRIKTTSTPTTPAKAHFIALGDADGEATLRQWNIVPIPTGAKGAGQDDRQCPYLPTYGSNFDGPLVVLSSDGKWLWEFYQAYSCPAFESGAWHANTVRKRARTYAASLEEPFGTGDGSGISSVTDVGGGNYENYDGYGSVVACSAVALPHLFFTREDYNAAIAPGSDGTYGHALFFIYTGEGPTTSHYGHYPCLKQVTGTKADIDANTKYMSFGRRLQIKSSYNCTTNIPTSETGYLMKRATCETMKKYGAIFADIGGSNAKGFEAESSYGRSGVASPWYGVTFPSPALPYNVWSTTNLQIVEPVCDNASVCTDVVTFLQPPTSPSAADVTPDNGGVVRLSWTVSASAGVTEQRIYRGTATGVYSETPIQVISDNTTATYDDAGLTNGTTYYYILRAYNGTHLSAYSTEVSATPSSQEPPVTPNSRDKVTRTPVTRSKVTRGAVVRP